MRNTRKRRTRQQESKAEVVRSWVLATLDVKGKHKALDLNKVVIPTLNEMMGKRYKEGINRAFLLNCITTKNSGIKVRFDGNDRMTVSLVKSQHVGRPQARTQLRLVS